jgi:hypothetical protein
VSDVVGGATPLVASEVSRTIGLGRVSATFRNSIISGPTVFDCVSSEVRCPPESVTVRRDGRAYEV